VRNDADESTLQSAIRVALGRPAARGTGGGLCAALTVMRAFAVENLSSQVISSCPTPDRQSIRAVSAAVGQLRPGWLCTIGRTQTAFSNAVASEPLTARLFS